MRAAAQRMWWEEGLGIGDRAAAATDATFRRLRVARDQANVDDGSAARQGKSRARMGHRRRGATEALAAPLNRQQLTMYSMMTRTLISAAATVTAACRLLYSSEHPAKGTAAIAFNY